MVRALLLLEQSRLWFPLWDTHTSIIPVSRDPMGMHTGHTHASWQNKHIHKIYLKKSISLEALVADIIQP